VFTRLGVKLLYSWFQPHRLCRSLMHFTVPTLIGVIVYYRIGPHWRLVGVTDTWSEHGLAISSNILIFVVGFTKSAKSSTLTILLETNLVISAGRWILYLKLEIRTWWRFLILVCLVCLLGCAVVKVELIWASRPGITHPPHAGSIITLVMP
jgi:hypothetical protein